MTTGMEAVVDRAGDELSNNLFTDLAPLLSLFGERFAQQYMSRSLNIADHIIFACAPLGVVTALVSAIRVGGPLWLRALIGRARENRATVEIELLSSTSHEVCELWNGHGIIRTLGRSKLSQIVFFESEKDNPETFGLYTVQEAVDKGLMVRKDYNDPLVISIMDFIRRQFPMIQKILTIVFCREKSSSRRQSDEETVMDTNPTFSSITTGIDIDGKADARGFLQRFRNRCTHNSTGKCSKGQGASEAKTSAYGNKDDFVPNMSLNIGHPIAIKELALFAFFGVIVQLALLFFTAYVTYSPGLSSKPIFQKDGGRVPSYTYPIMATGTILLCFSMAICSSIVEWASAETIWVPHSSEEGSEDPKSARIRVLWLQPAGFVGDQAFESSVIFGNEREFILASQRMDSVFYDYSLYTCIGVLAGLVGFVLQFQMLRFMNWSASVAQLISIAIMTAVRAWVRRDLSATPITKESLGDNAMEWLALWLSSSNSPGEAWPKKQFDHDDDRAGSAGVLLHEPQRQRPGGKGDCDEEYNQDVNLASEAWFSQASKYGNYYLFENSIENQVESWCPDISNKIQFIEETEEGELEAPQIARWAVRTGIDNVAMRGKFGTIEDWNTQIEAAISPAKRILQIRKRLAHLTKWPSASSAAANALASSIELTLDTHFPEQLLEHFDFFEWDIQISLGSKVANIKQRALRLLDKKSWHIDSTELEAILSLWLYDHGKTNRKVGPHTLKEENLQHQWQRGAVSLGVNDEQLESECRICWILGCNDGNVKRDVDFWVKSDDGSELETDSLPSGRNAASNESHILGFSGFCTFNEKPTLVRHDGKLCYTKCCVHSTLSKLTTTSNAPLVFSFARHIFASFYWALVGSEAFKERKPEERLSKTEIHANKFSLDDPETISGLQPVNRTIQSIAQGIVRTGLCSTTEQALSCIIPPLSFEKMLPQSEILDYIQRRIVDHGQDQWKIECSKIYDKALTLYEPLGYASPIVARILFSILHSYFHALEEYSLRCGHEQSTLHSEEITSATENYTLRAEQLEKQVQNGVQREMNNLYHLITTRLNPQNQHNPYGHYLFGAISLLYVMQDRFQSDLWAQIQIRSPERFTTGDIVMEDFMREYFLLWHLLYLGDYSSSRTLETLETILKHPSPTTDLINEGISYIEEWGHSYNRSPILSKNSSRFDLLYYSTKIREPSAVDFIGRNRLHYLVADNSSNCDDIMKELRDGVDPLQADHFGWTPLHICVFRDTTTCEGNTSNRDFLNILRALRRGVNPDYRDVYMKTPLHYASEYGKPYIVKALLDLDADPLCVDAHKRTPLCLAVLKGHLEVVKLLLDQGSRKALHIRDNLGSLPVHMAAASGNVKVLKSIFEAAVSGKTINPTLSKRFLNLIDGNGRTSLHIAAMRGGAEIVEYLLQQGSRVGFSIDVDLLDDYGFTPLIYASVEGHVEIVRKFLESPVGVDPYRKDGRGLMTPLSWAVEHGNGNILDCFIERNLVVRGEGCADTPENRPLAISVRKGYIHLVSKILDESIATPLTPNELRAALVEAANYHRADAIPLLVSSLKKTGYHGHLQSPLPDNTDVTAEYLLMCAITSRKATEGDGFKDQRSTINGLIKELQKPVTMDALVEAVNARIINGASEALAELLAHKSGREAAFHKTKYGGNLLHFVLEQSRDEDDFQLFGRFNSRRGPSSRVNPRIIRRIDREKRRKAAERGEVVEIIKMLFSLEGADQLVIGEDNKGRLPIHLAVETGDLTVVQLLLEPNVLPTFLNGNFNEKNRIENYVDKLDDEKNTPLSLSVKRGFDDIVGFLLQHVPADRWLSYQSLGTPSLIFVLTTSYLDYRSKHERVLKGPEVADGSYKERVVERLKRYQNISRLLEPYCVGSMSENVGDILRRIDQDEPALDQFLVGPSTV